MMMWNDAGWTPFLVFPLMMMLVMAVMVTLMMRVGRRSGWPPFFGTSRTDHQAGPSSEKTREDPLVVLRERYARGEIEHEEFERTLDGLLRTEDQQISAPRTRRSTQ